MKMSTPWANLWFILLSLTQVIWWCMHDAQDKLLQSNNRKSCPGAMVPCKGRVGSEHRCCCQLFRPKVVVTRNKEGTAWSCRYSRGGSSRLPWNRSLVFQEYLVPCAQDHAITLVSSFLNFHLFHCFSQLFVLWEVSFISATKPTC